MASQRDSLIATVSGIVIAFSLGLVLATAAQRYRAPVLPKTPGIILVHDDPGGEVQGHLKWWKRVADSHVPVRIDSYCYSACTFFLGFAPAAQVCMTPRASLGFHLASTNGQPDRAYSKLIFARLYPPVVKNWIHKGGALTPNIREMKASTAIALHVVHACP